MSTDLQRSLAMFRFNFWAKPFFTPPPGTGGMDAAPHFVPNPLTSPALMVLASSAAAEGHDVQRLQAAQQQQQHSPHHPSYPGRGMDKDLPPPPPPPFSTAAFMYRPGDPFSAPLYSPLSFVRPELDRRLALMNPGMRPGAFRPLTPSGSAAGGDVDVPQSGYHSAFSPASAAPSSAKKSKPEQSSSGSSSSAAVIGASSTSASSSASTSSANDHLHPHHLHGAQFPDHGQQHDERPPSLCYRGDSEDGQAFSPSQHGGGVKEERPSSLCSSQGYETVSEAMSDSGDAYERGTPDSEGRSLRKQRKRASHDGQTPCCPVCGLTLRAGELEAHLMLEIDKLDRLSRGGRKSRDTTPQGRKSLPSPGGSRRGKDSPPPEVASRSRYDSFMRIRCNRQSRLNARRGQRKRRPGEEGVKETMCPICNERLTGATEELNAHVEMCLKQRTGVDEEEPVDVEGEFEEYEWAGQTRVRATSMLEGGFSGSGFQTSKKGSDEDAELNVDGDDTEEYGKPQFSERDMVPLGSNGDSPGTSGSAQTFPSENSFASRTDTVNSDGAGCSSSSTAYEIDLPNSDDSGHATSALLSALRLKLQDLQAEKAEKQKCLICMEPYKTPLTSIQCWHVHCENCWMRTLGAKKLCPQCNMITSPSDLRRIYL